MRDLRVEPTEIPGLLIVRLGLQYNDDGWFKEDWHRAKMVALGLPDFDPVQRNITHVVSRGTTRGFLAEPWDRLVSVVQGRAMGAWVDLREGEGFGRTVTCDLDLGTAVFIPRGVANAHQVLEDDTTFTFLLEHHWTPQGRGRASSVDLFDPELDIPWPIGRDQAIVAHRDKLNPRLADAKPIAPRRALVVGTESRLGRALLAELPGADGLPTSAFDVDASALVDISAYDTIINAHGDTGTGLAGSSSADERWRAAAARANRLTDIARRHHLRYVHVSTDCVFEHSAPEHPEEDPLSVSDPHAQALVAGELVAAGVHRHLIIRTGWVVARDESFVDQMVTAARRGQRPAVVGDQYGRLTFARQLAAGITHLLDIGAPAGVYNITGDGPVVTWAEVARQIFQLAGADPDRVLAIDTPAPGGTEASAPSEVLSLKRIKAIGFRPGNSWLELADQLPVPSRTRGAGQVSAPQPRPDGSPRRYRVLFVCTANICRSAYADVVANHHAPAWLEFSSAGIRALVDHGIDPPMAIQVGQRGDTGRHRARQLTRDLMSDADLVITMSAEHRRYILDEWPALGRKAFVIGHVAREMAQLPETVTLDTLVDRLWTRRTAEDTDEVADPHGRGLAAAEAASRQIDQHLEFILSGLDLLHNRENETITVGEVTLAAQSDEAGEIILNGPGIPERRHG